MTWSDCRCKTTSFEQNFLSFKCQYYVVYERTIFPANDHHCSCGKNDFIAPYCWKITRFLTKLVVNWSMISLPLVLTFCSALSMSVSLSIVSLYSTSSCSISVASTYGKSDVFKGRLSGCRLATSETGMQQSTRYFGALFCRHRCTSSASLYCTYSVSSHQCSLSCSRCIKPWSNLRMLVARPAAAFSYWEDPTKTTLR